MTQHYYCAASTEGPPPVRREKDKAGRTVRFRVASAYSGRVLTEVFKDEAAAASSWSGSATWSGSVTDSVDSDCSASSPETEEPVPAGSKANSHLNGLLATTTDNNSPPGESGCEPDDLLLYASAKRRRGFSFSDKRVNICSKNGTIRGVMNKVSAGQVLYNNLANVYSGFRGNRTPQRRLPWEKD